MNLESCFVTFGGLQKKLNKRIKQKSFHISCICGHFKNFYMFLFCFYCVFRPLLIFITFNKTIYKSKWAWTKVTETKLTFSIKQFNLIHPIALIWLIPIVLILSIPLLEVHSILPLVLLLPIIMILIVVLPVIIHISVVSVIRLFLTQVIK